MKLAVAILIAAIPLWSATTADAKGCIKGAIIGGVAGHLAGGHGTVGAVAGCAIGHHEANKKDKNAQPNAADSGKQN